MVDASSATPADGSRTPGEVPKWLQRTSAWAWRIVAIAAALWVLGQTFKRLELVLVPVTVALFVTTVLQPPAAFLRRRGFGRTTSTWIVFLAVALVIAGIVMIVEPSVGKEFRNLGSELDRASTKVRDRLSRPPFDVQPADYDRYLNDLRNAFTENRVKLFDEITASAELLLRSLAATFLALALSFFFVKDGDRIAERIFEAAGSEQIDFARAVARDAWGALTGYVRGTAINGAVNATAIGAGLLVLRVPLVFPIVLVTMLSAFVPLLGAVVSGAIAALVALVARGPGAALVIVGITVVVHHLEGYVVGPFVLGRRVRLHPVVVLLSLTVGSVLGGLVGAFYAVPVVAVVASMHQRFDARARAT